MASSTPLLPAQPTRHAPTLSVVGQAGAALRVEAMPERPGKEEPPPFTSLPSPVGPSLPPGDTRWRRAHMPRLALSFRLPRLLAHRPPPRPPPPPNAHTYVHTRRRSPASSPPVSADRGSVLPAPWSVPGSEDRRGRSYLGQHTRALGAPGRFLTSRSRTSRCLRRLAGAP